MSEVRSSFEVGRRLIVPVIPPVEQRTRFIDAGAVVVGIEYRWLDDAVLDELFDAPTRETTTVAELRPDAGVDDRGLAIHVFDAATRTEWVRFDCFEENPHYHYVAPDGGIVVAYDTVAEGPMLPWVVERFRTRRVLDMVAAAGGPPVEVLGAGTSDADLADAAGAIQRSASEPPPARD